MGFVLRISKCITFRRIF